MAQIVGFASGSKSSSGWLSFLKTLEPLFSADNENVICMECSVTAPFVPALVWTTWISVEEELIEDDVNTAVTQTLAKFANAFALLVLDLPITDKYLRHSAPLERNKVAQFLSDYEEP